jgi:hypothetical protein
MDGEWRTDTNALAIVIQLHYVGAKEFIDGRQ